jgi:hypothetical protein
VQNASVAFEIQEPNSTSFYAVEGFTDSNGVVTVSTQMPWPSTDPDSLLGTWTATAITQVGDEIAEDVMQFQYDYIVHIWNVTTDSPPPEPGPPPGYGHGDPVNIYVTYGSYYMQQPPISQSYPVLILAEIADNLVVTIGISTFTTTVGGAVWGEYKNWTISMFVDIPKSAYAGAATVYVSVYDGLEPMQGGVAISPEWVGPTIVILPISVPPKASVTFNEIGVGSDYNGTVVVVDGGGYSSSQLPVSFIWSVGSIQNFTFLSRLVGSVTSYHWNATTGLSSLESESLNVTVSGTITGIYITGIHEVIITNVTAPPWMYHDILVVPHECANISVTISNVGDFAEDVTVTLYYNITADLIIGSFQIQLAMAQNFTYKFTWNTAVDVAYGTYTLTAVATIPTGSYTYVDGNITVRLVGDVNGDGKVDLRDLAAVARAYGSTPGSPNWNPAADINGDGIVNMKDIALVVRFLGSSTTAY